MNCSIDYTTMYTESFNAKWVKCKNARSFSERCYDYGYFMQRDDSFEILILKTFKSMCDYMKQKWITLRSYV